MDDPTPRQLTPQPNRKFLAYERSILSGKIPCPFVVKRSPKGIVDGSLAKVTPSGACKLIGAKILPCT